MSVISRSKELINNIGKEEAIKVIQLEIDELGEPKNFQDICKLSGLETAIKYITEYEN